MSASAPTNRTVIYHNPRCSKSRATLELLQKRGIEPEIIRYLETPLDSKALHSLTQLLDRSIHEVVRRGEQEYKALGVGANKLSEDEMIEAICQSPILLERPIVIHNNRAEVGRPPENVLALFD